MNPEFGNRQTPEQQLAQQIKERGLADAETKEALQAWYTGEQQIIDETYKGPEQADAYRQAQLELNIKLAHIYLEAGHEMDAAEAYQDTREQAERENRTEHLQQIYDGMDEAEDMKNN